MADAFPYVLASIRTLPFWQLGEGASPGQKIAGLLGSGARPCRPRYLFFAIIWNASAAFPFIVVTSMLSSFMISNRDKSAYIHGMS